MSELDALQPGAIAIKYMALPPTSTLIWIISDQVDAPANPKAKPFEVTGALVNEMAGNPNFEHGFVLRTQNGTIYPLVL